jgi:uncharacterized Tic20 family protein
MTSNPAHDWPSSRADGATGRDPGNATWAMLAYLGAIFLGPLIPLAVYLTRRNKSPFMRYHAVRALNISVTVALYVICCAILGGMLALDTVTVALAVALPLVFVLWLSMLKYLIRGAVAANRGEAFDVPGWLCATIASLDIRRQRPHHGVRQQPAAAGEHQ